MPVEVNISEHIYDFIDPNTGQKYTAEEFSKKYPGLDITRHAPNSRGQEAVKTDA